jgi:hypothetical protein
MLLPRGEKMYKISVFFKDYKPFGKALRYYDEEQILTRYPINRSFFQLK